MSAKKKNARLAKRVSSDDLLGDDSPLPPAKPGTRLPFGTRNYQVAPDFKATSEKAVVNKDVYS